jgi:uncharacterized membrane protein (DUF373 family)
MRRLLFRRTGHDVGPLFYGLLLTLFMFAQVCFGLPDNLPSPTRDVCFAFVLLAVFRLAHLIISECRVKIKEIDAAPDVPRTAGIRTVMITSDMLIGWIRVLEITAYGIAGLSMGVSREREEKAAWTVINDMSRALSEAGGSPAEVDIERLRGWYEDAGKAFRAVFGAYGSSREYGDNAKILRNISAVKGQMLDAMSAVQFGMEAEGG